MPVTRFDATEVLFDHACDTLPDSLARRRLVLQALKVKAHPGHVAYPRICAQLAAVDAIAELQRELRAVFADPGSNQQTTP